MKPLCALISLLLMSACGVDGEPVSPQVKVKTGISVGATAKVGVSVSL